MVCGKPRRRGPQISPWKARDGVIRDVGEVGPRFGIIESGNGYGLANTAGVGISESTCPGVFVAAPRGRGGQALFDVSELLRIGLERGGSAREVVEVMGGLAEEHGFYGSVWEGGKAEQEAGEALFVSDAKESWVFHVLADDTGASAVWAAQRVPHGEVAVVANQFLIREVRIGEDGFLGSSNLKGVARRSGRHDGGEFVDFAKVFGPILRHAAYTTHRLYKVLTMVDPALVGKLDPYPNTLMDGYPFSVKPRQPLSVDDIFRIYRDHCEGVEGWDLSISPAAEPFGNPERIGSNAAGKYSPDEITAVGEFGRTSSIGRTSYVAVVRSTNELPPEVGPMIYYSQQQPDASVFLPIYVAAAKLPPEFTRGSLFRHDSVSMFWAVTLVSNWVGKHCGSSIEDVRAVQERIEKKLFAVLETEANAVKLINAGKSGEAVELLGKFSTSAAATSRGIYQKLFKTLVARCHDDFHMEDAEAVDIKMTTMFHSVPWLEKAGFFSMSKTGGGNAAIAPVGVVRSEPETLSASASAKSESRNDGKYVLMVATFASGIATGIAGSIVVGIIMKIGRDNERKGYAEIA